MEEAFCADDHSIWYLGEEEKRRRLGLFSKPESSGGYGNGLAAASFSWEALWKNVANRMQVDLETFGKIQGFQPGALIQNLTQVNRERYDYSAFLKKFAVLGEAMRINDDEYDYIFYTYGLSRYKNMPLIEPLEYKEVKRIREFVIALDTSGSTAGELVQRFMQKTYNILKSTESFFQRSISISSSAMRRFRKTRRSPARRNLTGIWRI